MENHVKNVSESKPQSAISFLFPKKTNKKNVVSKCVFPIFHRFFQNNFAANFLSNSFKIKTKQTDPIKTQEPIDLKKGHHPSPKDWKSTPAQQAPDFTFEKPVVDIKSPNATQEEKKLVEKRCLAQFKNAMGVMDHSIADAVSHMMGEKKNPELWETLDKFSTRFLDLYEAYLEVQKDNNEPFFYSDIGFAKAYGLTHQDLKNLIEPAHWLLLQPKEMKKQIMTSTLPKKALNAMNENEKENVVKIQNLYSRLGQFGVKKDAIDELVEKLSQLKDAPFYGMKGKDLKFALLEEIRSRTSNGEKEPGFLGSPLRLLNVVRGKHHTKIDPSAEYRQKLYFIYKSKSIANEIASNPEMQKKINQKLEKKGWQIDEGIAEFLYQSSPTIPIFKLGPYAHENHAKGKIREPLPIAKTLEEAAKYPNHTFSENKNSDALTSPFRFKPSEGEEMAYLGSTSEIEKREMAVKSNKKTPTAPNTKADTSYLESPHDYKKRTTPLPWIAGRHYFKLHDNKECKSPYLKAVNALGLPQKAGISGSTDQTLTMAGLVGVSSKEEINRLRLIYLGWMTSHDDHSVDEILTAAKSFGIPYTPKPDYYKEIYAEDPNFVAEVANEQKKRGLKMPDFYLSKEHAQAELGKIRHEKEKKQAQKVQAAMSDHRLFLKAVKGKQNTPEQYKNDLFGTNSWNGFLNNLETPKKVKKDDGKIKYVYNPTTKKLEAKKKSKIPSYKGTKKTSVSLLPSNGKILPYRYDINDTVGLLFDRKESEFKDKYVFKADALTDNKWWRRIYTPAQTKSPEFSSLLQKDVKKIQSKGGGGKEQSFNHLRVGSFQNLINLVEKNKQFQEHNEILASLKKEGVMGVFCFNKSKPKGGSSTDDLYIRLKAISNKIALKEKHGLDVPVFVIDQAKDQGLKLYSRTEQAKDLTRLTSNQHGEFDAMVEFLSQKLHLNKEQIAPILQNDLQVLQQKIA